MANPRKIDAVDDLTSRFNSSHGAVLTEYRGLSVAQLQELRRSLGSSADYRIVKNTLTKRALAAAGLQEVDGDLLTGPTAIAFITGDLVEAAKSLKTFGKDHAALVVKGGVLDGRTVSPAEIARIADLESREVLLAKMAGAMKASMSGAAALFNAPLTQAARTIDALRLKRETGAEEAADFAQSSDGSTESSETAEAPAEA